MPCHDWLAHYDLPLFSNFSIGNCLSIFRATIMPAAIKTFFNIMHRQVPIVAKTTWVIREDEK